MQKFVAPRVTQRGLKIVIFGVKLKENVKKVGPRTYFSKTTDLSMMLAPFWLLFGPLADPGGTILDQLGHTWARLGQLWTTMLQNGPKWHQHLPKLTKN